MKKAKCIMIQGTASSVGKSLITAGLCRLLKQDGYRVAPFKSQNLALNSFVTRDGKEMGRAQVVQAEAAGVEPSADMNPVLIKPTSDKKSQLIVNGKVYCDLSVGKQFDFKAELLKPVRAAYERLAQSFDVIVIEGAGSPVEINIKDNDIVDMGMAEIADAPVLLIGDIDRGGVFASLAGTMLLFSDAERSRVKGVIINKFRGDLGMLTSGLHMLEEIIKTPVIGVLPYLDISLEDEDSAIDRLEYTKSETGELDIVVIKLPHISNFTDFNALESLKGVSVRYAAAPAEIGKPDLIILPGTKNTIEDLLYLRKTGIEDEIKRLHEKGTVVFGICGGYQMLGKRIRDPLATETDIPDIAGISLLEAETVFLQEKSTRQVEAELTGSCSLLDGLHCVQLRGYEIHMGKTEYAGKCVPFLMAVGDEENAGKLAAGIRNEAGNVFGTYIHGLFDNLEFTVRFINNLRSRKGLGSLKETTADYKGLKEQQYDRLADALRDNLDIGRLYEIIGL